MKRISVFMSVVVELTGAFYTVWFSLNNLWCASTDSTIRLMQCECSLHPGAHKTGVSGYLQVTCFILTKTISA